MKWHKLENDSDIPKFMDAAIALLRPTLMQLCPLEKTHFYDWWLRRFNDSDSYLMTDEGRFEVIVTVPHVSDIHSYRWNARILLVRHDRTDPVFLPAEINLNRSFFVPNFPLPSVNETRILQIAVGQVVQLEYGRLLDETLVETDCLPIDGITIRRATAEDYDDIMALIERAYVDLTETSAGLYTQREELQRILEYDFGWCYVAESNRESKARIVGMASYITMHVPVIGVPGALVADLAVEPVMRRKGIAKSLQLFAYRQLSREGLRWLFGNIAPENESSLKQVESLGRTIWGRAVHFKQDS
jgi:ribosomal protein S18 acetylase RimI-like enzyme